LDDAKLEHMVRRVLAMASGAQNRPVHAEVHEGVVHLSGKVPSSALAYSYIDLISQIRGVRDVRNRLVAFRER
jgi:osmotically-inducible protein OsmY